MSILIKFLREKPAYLLLLLVFLYILPRSLSYDHAWMQPEEFFIKIGILKTGPELNAQDLKTGLFWQLFEYQPRCTRPLSAYFEILDTKFRCWLWNYILPHPSLSLTWIFSLILAPLFLYRLLRNCGIGLNTAIAMAAFYLVTPGVLSYEVMLFRPAKPMTNFFLIFCLYAASRLKKNFIDEKKDIPWKEYLYLWALSFFSIFWDETALLIIPALLFIFPQVLRRKTHLILWLFLPAAVLLAYLKIIPYLSFQAGHDWPHLNSYDKIGSLKIAEDFYQSFKYLRINTKNLIFETLGLIPFSAKASGFLTAWKFAAVMSWGVIGYYLLRVKKKWASLFIFLILLILFFNYTIAITMQTWGPYYYGAFWSVFFVIYAARLLDQAPIPKYILTCCLFFILINMSNCFIATNTIYKKNHYYSYNPGEIELYFSGKKLRFDPQDTPAVSGRELKNVIYDYWSQVKDGKSVNRFSLPRELCWLPIEVEPTKEHKRYEVLSEDYEGYLDTN